MVRLRRTVRFSIDPSGSPADGPARTIGSSPPLTGLAAVFELDVTCTGEPDERSAYVADIQAIDRATLGIAVPRIGERFADPPAGTLRSMLEPLRAALPAALESVRWRVSPYHSLEMAADRPQTVLFRERFEFAASHRLHNRALSAQANRELFGKCNNPSGHGHNYVIEPCVEVDLDETGSTPVTWERIARVTKAAVLDRLDHTHLNADVAEFRDDGGLIPSVENIARVCFGWLETPVRELPGSPRLCAVTVWETDRTCATYPAD